ncbi:MAG: hypothetical protein ACEPO8_06060 [Rhodothermaceae bacterium]
MKNQLIYEYFSDDDFLRISNCIGETEKITSGEIRISIKETKSFSDRNRSIIEMAQKEFYNPTELIEMGKVLSEYFPIKADDTNELSNKVVL